MNMCNKECGEQLRGQTAYQGQQTGEVPRAVMEARAQGRLVSGMTATEVCRESTVGEYLDDQMERALDAVHKIREHKKRLSPHLGKPLSQYRRETALDLLEFPF